MTSPHLTREIIADLHADRLNEEALAELDEHLSTCDACTELLEQVDSNEFSTALSERLAPKEINTETLLSDADSGHIQLNHVIGSGGAGVVYSGYDSASQKKVAIKVLKPELAVLDSERRRFFDEAALLQQERSANLVEVYSVGPTAADQLPYFIMEFVEGDCLADVMELSTHEVVSICIDVASALIGTSIIHRDIKPRNIIVQRDRSGASAKLLDFGIAVDVDAHLRLTGTGMSRGTVAYMSPEQLGRGRQLTQQTDVFSLGVVLFEVLTATHPFHARTPAELILRICDPNQEVGDPRRFNSSIPQSLSRIIRKSLQKRLADRYSSLRPFREDLQKFKRGETVSVRLPGRVRMALRWARANPALASGITALVFSLAMLFVWNAGRAWVAEQQQRLAETKRLKEKAELVARNARSRVAAQTAYDAQSNHCHQFAAVAFAEAVSQADTDRRRLALAGSLSEALHPVAVRYLSDRTADGVAPPYSLLKASTSYCKVTNELLVSGGSDKSHPYLRLYDLTDLSHIRDYENSNENGDLRWFIHAHLSPNGRSFLTLDFNGKLAVFDTDTGETIWERDGTYPKPSPPGPTPLMSDGFHYSLLALQWQSDDVFGVFLPGGTLQLWGRDTTGFKLLQQIPLPPHSNRLFLKTDSVLLLTPKEVVRFDLTDRSTSTILSTNATEGSFTTFQLSPDRNRLVCADDNRTLTCWEISDKEAHRRWKRRILDVPDAADSSQQAANLDLSGLSAPEQGMVHGMRHVFPRMLTGLAIHQSGRLAAMLGDGTTIQVNSETGDIENRAFGHIADIWGMHWNECVYDAVGNLVTIGSDGTLRKWQRGTSTTSRISYESVFHQLTDCTYSPARDEWAASGRGKIYTWSREDRKIKTSWQEDAQVFDLAYHSANSLAYGLSNAVVIRDVDSGEELDRFRMVSYPDKLTALRFSPDGQFIVSGTASGIVRQFTADGKLITEWDINVQAADSIVSIAIRPDGEELAIAESSGRLSRWSCAPETVPAFVRATVGAVSNSNGISYGTTPAGIDLAHVGKEGQPRVYCSDNRQVLLSGHPRVGPGAANSSKLISISWVPTASFSPDGALLITGGAAGELVVRDTTSYRIRTAVPAVSDGNNASREVAVMTKVMEDNRIRNLVMDIEFSSDGEHCFVVGYSGSPFEVATRELHLDPKTVSRQMGVRIESDLESVDEATSIPFRVIEPSELDVFIEN